MNATLHFYSFRVEVDIKDVLSVETNGDKHFNLHHAKRTPPHTIKPVHTQFTIDTKDNPSHNNQTWVNTIQELLAPLSKSFSHFHSKL